MRFFPSFAASKYSRRAARSRTRVISSRRRPKLIRAITRAAPGMLSETTVFRLSQAAALSKRHHQFVVRNSLRPCVVKLPLQARLGIFERGHIRNHAAKVNAHELPGELPHLKHHAQRRLLPRRLVQSVCREIILRKKFERHQDFPAPRRERERKNRPVLLLAQGQMIANLY